MNMLTILSIVLVFLRIQSSSGKCPILALFNAEADARAIYDHSEAPNVVRSILACRSGIQRIAVNEEYKMKCDNKRSLDRRTENPMAQVFFQNDSDETSSDPYQDCVDVLVDIQENVFIRYIDGAFHTTYDDATALKMLFQIFVVADLNKKALVDKYNEYGGSNEHVRDEISDNYSACDWRNMLRSITKKMRAPDEEAPIDNGEVQKQVDRVLKEKRKEGWDDHRKHLEETLMEKSKAFVRAFLPVYAASNNNISLEDDIRKDLEHNDLLVFGYTSLIQAAVNMNKFVASRIHENPVEQDKTGTMTVFICHFFDNRPTLEAIKAEFRMAYHTPMQKFILDQDPTNPLNLLLAEMVGEDPPPGTIF